MTAARQAVLTMTSGPSVGQKFPLDPQLELRIGRGVDCQIVLNDLRCSRVHACLAWQNGRWWVRDASSTNGTFVNGQKIDDAQLADGQILRVGSTEFLFQSEPDSADELLELSENVTQSVVREKPIGLQDSGDFVKAAAHETGQAGALHTLHELCLRLLGRVTPDEAVRTALEMLRERTHASLVGFMSLDDQARLRPQLTLPEESAAKVRLSAKLTETVCERRRAVWVEAQTAGARAEPRSHFADAICVPLLDGRTTIGVVHLYLERGRFKPAEFDFVLAVVNVLAPTLVRARRDASLAAENRRLAARTADVDEMIGSSPPMLELKARIVRLAKASGCVLIRGESGSGKELAARAVHRASARADRPHLAVNCAALPRELMESQLFGHKKGAFTGADQDHAGWFQQADGGTLMLDEVGELTLEGQAKLLRILEGHPFLPVGAVKEVRVDVRVIAATNRDLAEFVREGRFREDLYYRLSVFELTLPPLRDRGADVGLLIDHFLEHFRRQHNRPRLELTDDARRKLLDYRWPGNVRQLRNVLDSAVVLAEGERIEPHDLGLRDAGPPPLESLDLARWERRLIAAALERAGGRVPEAAKLLGIGRATLYRKLEENQELA